MENTNQTTQEVDKSEEILAKARANKKTIMWCLIIAAVCVVGMLAYILVAQNGSRKADELIAKADAEQNDSIALNLYAKAADAGYKSGNRAKAEMGIRLYNDGKYQEALEYLNDCSLDDEIAEAGVETLKGDCYVNLDQLDKALGAYKSAISEADENPRNRTLRTHQDGKHLPCPGQLRSRSQGLQGNHRRISFLHLKHTYRHPQILRTRSRFEIIADCDITIQACRIAGLLI